jgi:hypothetical protein
MKRADRNLKSTFWSFAIKQFEIDVGTSEIHRIEFRFNQSIGNLRISVDKRPIIRRFEMLSVSTTKRYSFNVGNEERHAVIIEKTRRRAMGGFLPQICTVFVDGSKVAEF